MAQHTDSKSIPKGYGTPGRKIIVNKLPNININSTLDKAIVEGRTPTGSELLDEAKAIVGKVLVGLRSTGDIYKTATAITNVVKSIAAIITIEKVEEVSGEALKLMSDDELKEYASKLLDKLN